MKIVKDKPRIEHCPCITPEPWHYRVCINEFNFYCGTWQQCVQWLIDQNTYIFKVIANIHWGKAN